MLPKILAQNFMAFGNWSAAVLLNANAQYHHYLAVSARLAGRKVYKRSSSAGFVLISLHPHTLSVSPKFWADVHMSCFLVFFSKKKSQDPMFCVLS
jgi:hypothetical protein